MNNRYVAAIMKKCSIDKNTYMFIFDSAAVGNYDPVAGTFTDICGNIYHQMEKAITENEGFAVHHIMDKDDLTDLSNSSKDIEDILDEYIDKMDKKVYAVGHTKNKKLFSIPIDINTKIKEYFKKYKTQPETTVEEYLNQMILDVVDGIYSKEEIKEKLEILENLKDVLENTISTAEIQIEAKNKNKTYKECLEEKIDEANKETTSDSTKEKKDEFEKEKKDAPKELPKKVTKPAPTKKTNRININKLYKSVTKTLIAQDEPARRVIAEIARKELEPLKKREGILLTGQSGSGKTKLMELIAKNLDRPFKKIDTTQLTVPGYTGKDIEEELWDLYVSCGRNKDKAEQAIIYFDEIDKKGSKEKSDISGQGVLNLLLSFIEGTTYKATQDTKAPYKTVPINTVNMTVIFSGAFSDVYRNLTEKPMGFDKNISSTPKHREAETKDFVEYGMMTDEFMGRVTTIKLNDLSLEDLKRILLESDESDLKIQEKIFKKLGVKIKFNEEFINKAAEKAYQKKTGARGLHGIVDEATWQALIEANDNENMYEEIVFTEKTLEDSSNYQFTKKNKK